MTVAASTCPYNVWRKRLRCTGEPTDNKSFLCDTPHDIGATRAVGAAIPSDRHLDPPGEVRLDVWLDVACLFRTRAEAQRACRGGKVAVNGQTAKPNRLLRPSDVIVVSRPFGRIQRVKVHTLADTHVAKADARRLYDDLTPAPTPEEIELRRLERRHRAAMSPPHAPDKRERRLLRRLKGRD